MINYSFKQFLINETPIPIDWDQTAITPNNTFKYQLNYAKERAKRIGGGSSRVAFIIKYNGRDTVLKIAKNKKGLQQNNVEADVLSDGQMKHYNITIPMIDYDTKSPLPRWIHLEFAQKATQNDFKKEINGTLHDLIGFVMEQLSISHWNIFTSREKMNKLRTDSPIVYNLVEFVGDFDFNPIEFNVLSNWGIYNNRLVIIDAGANNDIINTFYKY